MVTTLKQARQLKMLTQQEVADQIGVSIQSFQYWESGARQPRAKYQRKLCEVVDLTPQQMQAIMATFAKGLAEGEAEGTR